jgi:DNA-binding NtrC family response regulator
VIDADLAPTAVAAPDTAPILTVRVGATLDEVGRRLIEATLAECGSKRKAADMLGISLKTLYNRLAAYKAGDLDAEEESDAPAGKAANEEHRRAA